MNFSDDTWVWIENRVVPVAQARVPVLDRGFLYGDSVFEVTRTVARVPLFLSEHLDRLHHSATALGFGLIERATLIEAIHATLASVKAAESYVRIIVTRGAGPLDLDPEAADAPRLIVIAKPLQLPAAALYEDGVSLRLVGERRNAPGQVSAEIKSSNYLSSVLALRAARRQGAYEALMCDLDGYVSEGASSNFFMVQGGKLYTPPLTLGLLPGVTRAAVLKLAAAAGITLAEVPFRAEQILNAEEAFLTSSIRGILPVTRLDDKPIGSGKPEALTRLLMQRYAADYLERKSSASPMSKSSSKSPM